MQPAGYQRTTELNRQHDLLNTSQVMYCEKCGYVSTDPAVFNTHMLEHLATKYYCFYCNHVSYSKAELHVHLEQHTTKYPYTCQYCGQGYMTKDLLDYHIQCLHVNPPSKGLNKPEVIKNPHAPVPSALPRVTRNDTPSMRPLVRVRAPLIPPPARMEKGRQGSKVVDTHLPSGPKVGENLLSCTGEQIQHHRALTVSLPDEVSIPAGCLVELIEMKTVNGTKELKLRIVSQQGDESTIKDTRSISSQNTTFGKPLSSTSKNPNTQPGSAVMCMVNRKLSETKTLNAEHPGVFPPKRATSIPNSTSRGACGTKRTLKEMLDSAQCLTVHPTKVAKCTPNTVTEGTRGIKITPQETLKSNGAYPTISLVKPCNLSLSSGRSLPSKMPYRTNGLISEHPAIVSSRNASQPKIHLQDLQMAVKDEPVEVSAKDSTTPDMKFKHDYGLFLQKQQCLSVLRATNGQETLSLCKDKVSVELSLPNPNGHKTSISPLQIRLPKMGEDSTLKSQKHSAWTQSRRFNGARPIVGDTPEPMGFPVISHVFSLCQQPGDVQGAMQPLVKALQGIVMSKSNSPLTIPSVSAKTSNMVTGQKDETIVSASCAQVGKEDVSPHKTSVTQETSNAVKLENYTCSQLTQASPRNLSKLKKVGKADIIKDTKKSDPTSAGNASNVKGGGKGDSIKDAKKYDLSPAPKSQPIKAQDEALSNTAFNMDAPTTHSIPGQPPHLSENTEDASSKFLTVSLRRTRVGWWKPQKKRLRPSEVLQFKAQPHIDTSNENAILCPAPLRVDQLVKRPGPNQPVVVLNHPKPQVPKGGVRSLSITDTGTSDVVPKCQILKMRLGKVMGHKYEVIGCTVSVFS